MATVVQCPNPDCQKRCSLAESSNARTVRCPKCGKPFSVKPTAHDQRSDTRKSQPASANNPFPVLPTEFGRFRILKLLGRGGMGAVYLAEDLPLGRKVALKVPFFEPSESAMRIERFLREARLASALDHPNICTFLDAGEINGRPFLTMEYIAGTRLTREIDADKLMPQLRAAQIVHKSLSYYLEFNASSRITVRTNQHRGKKVPISRNWWRRIILPLARRLRPVVQHERHQYGKRAIGRARGRSQPRTQ